MKIKAILPLLLLLFISFNLTAQINNDKERYERKIQKFKPAKTIGPLLIVGGVCTATIGINNLLNLLPESEWQFSGDGLEVNDVETFKWLAISTAGVLMIGGGIALTIIGHTNTKKYQKKIDALTFVPLIAPKTTGVYLSYRF